MTIIWKNLQFDLKVKDFLLLISTSLRKMVIYLFTTSISAHFFLHAPIFALFILCPLPETIFHFKVSPDTCKPELRDPVLQMSSVFHSSLYRPQVPTILSCALGFEASSESRLHSSPGWKVLPQVPPAIGSLFPLPSPICLTARITQIFNRTTICAASRLRKASQSC